MAKILLVEDDNNLREIYEARLQAEGYEIVSARDGEEALTVAMKERPDLIISDVMMPKISGFDMLDIIRSTQETKDSKVIMMTALSQAEDKERATKLGADRYLVKSQVTLEDVAKVAREVLEGESSPNNKEPDSPAIEPTVSMGSDDPATPTEAPAEEAVTPTPEPPAAPEPQAPAPAPEPTTTAPVVDPTQVVAQATPAPAVASEPQTPAPAPAPEPTTTAPVVDPTQVVAQATPEPPTADADDQKKTSEPGSVESLGQSVAEEQDAIAAQIESFIDTKKTAETEPSAPIEPASPSYESTPTDTNTTVSTSESPKKKVIHPINDLNTSQSNNLDELLKKEEEKEQMAEIAKEISAKPENNEAADELSAEAALRAASRAPKTPDPSEESNTPEAPQVKISEDGNLELPSSGMEEAPSEEKPAETPIPTQSDEEPVLPQPEVPKPTPISEPTAVEQPLAAPQPQSTELPAPGIPHTNGTSIDGVSQPVQTTTPTPVPAPPVQPEAQTATPAPQPTPAPKSGGLDPNSISL